MPLPFFISQPHHSQVASAWGYLSIYQGQPVRGRWQALEPGQLGEGSP